MPFLHERCAYASHQRESLLCLIDSHRLVIRRRNQKSTQFSLLPVETCHGELVPLKDRNEFGVFEAVFVDMDGLIFAAGSKDGSVKGTEGGGPALSELGKRAELILVGVFVGEVSLVA